MRPSTQPVVWVLVRDLGRSGVPVVLDRLLGALGQRAGSVHVVAEHGGALVDRVSQRCASLTVLEPDGRRSYPDAVAVGAAVLHMPALGRAVSSAAWRRRLRHLPRPDVVVVHGAGAWRLAQVVPESTPVVLHVHELETGLDRSIEPRCQAAAFARARRILAVSAPVADLVVRRGADPRRVELLPGVVDLEEIERRGSASPSDIVADRRSGPAFVGGAGQPGWRKGTDRLAAVAHDMRRHGRTETVRWVGGARPAAGAQFVAAEDPVGWLPATDDPWRTLGGSSVVLVPSREDPLPLVALEAGARSIAVVAMPTGGLPALLADGRGIAVARQHVGEFTAAVLQLLADSDEAAAMGEALAAEVRCSYDARVVAPLWWETVLAASDV